MGKTKNEMKINAKGNVLKGQQILAQGKRSGALGLRTGVEFVRAKMFIKENFLFRTGEIFNSINMADFFIINKVIRLLFPLFVFLLRFDGEK